MNYTNHILILDKTFHIHFWFLQNLGARPAQLTGEFHDLRLKLRSWQQRPYHTQPEQQRNPQPHPHGMIGFGFLIIRVK